MVSLEGNQKNSERERFCSCRTSTRRPARKEIFSALKNVFETLKRFIDKIHGTFTSLKIFTNDVFKICPKTASLDRT